MRQFHHQIFDSDLALPLGLLTLTLRFLHVAHPLLLNGALPPISQRPFVRNPNDGPKLRNRRTRI